MSWGFAFFVVVLLFVFSSFDVDSSLWNFWDGTKSISSESAIDTQHIYWRRWIYPVQLTVTNMDGEYNTVTEKAFIWEIDYPIAAYSVLNSNSFYIQSSDKCRIEYESWSYNEEEAYPIDRYAKVTINPSRSVNTKWTSNK